MADETPQVYTKNILSVGDMYGLAALQSQVALGSHDTSAAVIGSILEEYNDRFEGTTSLIFQEGADALSPILNNSHASILENYNLVQSLGPDWRASVSDFDKLNNPVMLDIGVGNVQIYTAIGLLDEYNQKFPSSDPLGLKQYNSDYQQLALDLGRPLNSATVKFATLMVDKGMTWGQQNVANWESLSILEKEAFAVYFYNVGEEFMERRRDDAVAENGEYNVDIENTDIAQEYILNSDEIFSRLDPNFDNLTGIRELIANGAFDGVDELCFAPETPIDMWPLDPAFTFDPSNPDKLFDQTAVRAKIWQKPIAEVEVGDIVVSFDADGNLVPGPVTRTFVNDAKILLDFHGTRVTPGHVYFRPDSQRAYKYETLIDVLRDDGVIQHQDGRHIRATTNVEVGSPRDGFVRAVTGELRPDGTVVTKDAGRIRLGTRFIVSDGKTRKSFAVADLIKAGGGVVGDDELIHVEGGKGAPFHWEFSDTLPAPEDFVLACSATTLEDIYRAAEWEAQGPRLPAPMV
ncbi:MAG: hypothetical protein AAF231_05255, partial [Pseudomonadota bacterium]